MSDKSFPTPEEIQKEFEDFVQKRFGGNVQVVTQRVPSAHERQGPHAPAAPEAPKEKLDPSQFRFGYKPKDLKDYLDRFVIGQDDAKKALAIAVCDHYNHVAQTLENPENADNYAKQNVLLLGPTGVGKTYLVRQLARLIGVPFVKADATRFSETGYVGANVDDLVRDLVTQAAGAIDLAQFGIIYLDEADKLASSGASPAGRDVSGRGVQIGLLKLMEETDVDLTAGNDMRSQVQMMIEAQKHGRVERKVVNTRNILFIVSGAFQGLADVVKKRVGQEAIGFHRGHSQEPSTHDLLSRASTKDFVDYGFEPEFVGRLPVRVACHGLDQHDLLKVLKGSEGSVLRQYEAAFRAYGIDVTFSDAALTLIAQRAVQENTGARALMTVCEGILRNYKFELPSSAVKEFIVSEAVVTDPDAVLHQLLATPTARQFDLELLHIRRFEQEFFRTHGVSLHFDLHAAHALHAAANARGVRAKDLCEELLTSWEFGLKLIRQTSGQSSFHLGPEIVSNPKGELERLIVASYKSVNAGAGPTLPH